MTRARKEVSHNARLNAQLFALEMLDTKLVFAEFQHFVQVFCPEMLDLKLDFDGGLFLRARKTFSCRRVTMLDSMLDFLPATTRTGSRFSAKTDFLLEFLTLKVGRAVEH